MELDLLCLILALVAGTYVFLFGFVKNINEWYYVSGSGLCKKKKSQLPPGDMGWPYVGNMVSFARAFRSQNPDSFVNNLVHRYGETKIYKTSLFWSPFVIVCSPELCWKVLTDDERFASGYPKSFLKLNGEKPLLSVSNSEHKRLRKIISAPINGHEVFSTYIGCIEEIVISSLQEWANKNSPIEFYHEFKKISYNVITKIFLGSTDFMSHQSIAKYYNDMFRGLTAVDINVPGFTFHRAVKARKILIDLVQAHVNERRAKKFDEPNTKKGMIDLLFEVKYDDGEKMKDEDIVSLLVGLMLGGHETTAIAAMWLTIYFHDHPEMLQKAKEEQEEIMKKRRSSQKGLCLNEIRQMQYLSKALDETLRITSISFASFRKAKVDVEINGYIIPKGWRVLTWSKAVHMDSETYSNPKEFLPSRWDNHKPKLGSFIPFGGGSRRCPGADLTKLETTIFFHYFLLNYRFERINPKCPIKYLPSPCPVDNCLGKITKLPTN